VWELLGHLIIRSVETRIGDPVETLKLERLREKHPLIQYIEARFNEFFKPAGGLSCPELRERLNEFLKEYPEKTKKLVEAIVSEYYLQRRPRKTPKHYTDFQQLMV